MQLFFFVIILIPIQPRPAEIQLVLRGVRSGLLAQHVYLRNVDTCTAPMERVSACLAMLSQSVTARWDALLWSALASGVDAWAVHASRAWAGRMVLELEEERPAGHKYEPVLPMTEFTDT